MIEELRRLFSPSEEEARLVYDEATYVRELVQRGLEARGARDVAVEVGGSVAKGTWLPGQRDIDIFVVVPRGYPRRFVERDVVDMVIDVAAENGIEWAMKYADHPYVTLLHGGFEVDVVPCYRVEWGERPITAADRSPLHTRYVASRLNDDQKADVRVLKAFLKGIGVYGAEIKVEGFSGYLAELLIISHGTFTGLLSRVSREWRPYGVYVDIEGAYPPEELRGRFRAPLVVVDPVDPGRNAASAVSEQSLGIFIFAARNFLRDPAIEYFKPTDEAGTPYFDVPTLVVEMRYPQGESPDVVWGAIKRAANIIARKLEECEFKVYHHAAWTDESTVIYLAFTLENDVMPEYQLHEGPPVYSEASDRFVEKYLALTDVVGPYAHMGRWYVIRRRRYRSAVDCARHVAMRTIQPFLTKLVKDIYVTRSPIREIKWFFWKRPGWGPFSRHRTWTK